MRAKMRRRRARAIFVALVLWAAVSTARAASPRTLPLRIACSRPFSCRSRTTMLQSSREPPAKRAIPEKGSPARQRGRLSVLASAFLFGSNAPVVKAIYVQPGPPTAAALSAVRGLLIALPLLPALLAAKQPNGERGLSPACLRAAAELAAYAFAFNACVCIGLSEGGSATKAAFLAEAAVLFTPCILALTKQRVKPKVWLGSAVALVGVLALAFDASPAALLEAGREGMARTDLLFLASALAWSLTICRQGAFATSAELSGRVVEIQAAKNLLLAILFAGWFGVDVLLAGGDVGSQWAGCWNPSVWALVVFSAVGCELAGDLLQALGAKGVPATEANTLLTSEPLWAALLTSAFLKERLSAGEWLGGAVLVLGALISTTTSGEAGAGEGGGN